MSVLLEIVIAPPMSPKGSGKVSVHGDKSKLDDGFTQTERLDSQVDFDDAKSSGAGSFDGTGARFGGSAVDLVCGGRSGQTDRQTLF